MGNNVQFQYLVCSNNRNQFNRNVQYKLFKRYVELLGQDDPVFVQQNLRDLNTVNDFDYLPNKILFPSIFFHFQVP